MNHPGQQNDNDQNPNRSPQELAGPLVSRLKKLIPARSTPLFVALDGRSGTGKSTVATEVAACLNEAVGTSDIVTLIEGDQFYSGGSSQTWDRRSPAEKADWVIDWRRQRQLLTTLRDTGEAEWQVFDWDSADWDAEPAPMITELMKAIATPVVLVEGAYSARPELHDVLDLRVLLDVPVEVRRRQLLQREGDEYRADWEGRWSVAEANYFGTVMTPNRFDLILGSR